MDYMQTQMEPDDFEACRTCGVFFQNSCNYLRYIFPEGKEKETEWDMSKILNQLHEWNVNVSENDGFPQKMCIYCLGDFAKVLQLRSTCLSAQLYYYTESLPRIKTEVDDTTESLPHFKSMNDNSGSTDNSEIDTKPVAISHDASPQEEFDYQKNEVDHVVMDANAERPQDMYMMCINCPETFDNTTLLEHKCPQHKKNFSCPLCGKSFKLKFSLNRHCNNRHKVESRYAIDKT